eukprot:TRINITY_DN13658_c0_g1_i1.p1 TRINITY_DN13658_c0_g1~~TRINITY_DN13658_c0_g1_i1.p1  ORF type:complete len:152 (+),score=62.81 TRINITY_DN13658_c0_g1_i1:3-458(+)
MQITDACRRIDNISGQQFLWFFFFSSRRRHTRCREVSWARRCVQETGYQRRVHGQKVEKKLLTSPDPENNSMNPPENSSSSQNPKSHIQKSEQNSPSPKVESSPTAKPATKEEDVGIEEIADYINEDFETQQTSPHSIQKKKKKKKKSTLR